MENAEQYLASLMKAMQEFEHREFTDAQSQDAALTELLKLPRTMLEEMHQNCITTPNYWECDCDDEYIHEKVGANAEHCNECDSDEEDHADARLHDVLVNLRDGAYLSI
jgi:hypothetical protein